MIDKLSHFSYVNSGIYGILSRLSVSADQRLDLNKLGPNDNDTVRGQIVGKKHTHAFLSGYRWAYFFHFLSFCARSAYKKLQGYSKIHIPYFLKDFNYFSVIFLYLCLFPQVKKKRKD